MDDKHLKVVHLNTTVNHSSAPYKLHIAMKREGIDSQILAMSAEEGLGVSIVNRPFLYKIKRRFYYKKKKIIVRKLQ